MDASTMTEKARQVSAQMCATMAEAVLISAMCSGKLSNKEKRSRIEGCETKIKQQSKACKVEVKPLMHAAVLSEVSSWLLAY